MVPAGLLLLPRLVQQHGMAVSLPVSRPIWLHLPMDGHQGWFVTQALSCLLALLLPAPGLLLPWVLLNWSVLSVVLLQLCGMAMPLPVSGVIWLHLPMDGHQGWFVTEAASCLMSLLLAACGILLNWLVLKVVLAQLCGMAVPLPVFGVIWLHLPMDGHQVWFVTQAPSCLMALLLAAGDILLSWSVLSVVLLQLCGMGVPLPVSDVIWLHLPMDGHQGWFVTQAPSCLMALLLPAPGLLLPWVLLSWSVLSVVLLQLCGMAVPLPVSGVIWLHLPMDGHQGWFVTQALSCLMSLLLAAGGILLNWLVLNVVLLQLCGMAMPLPVSGVIWLHLPMDGHQVWFVTQAPSCLMALLLAAGDILLN